MHRIVLIFIVIVVGILLIIAIHGNAYAIQRVVPWRLLNGECNSKYKEGRKPTKEELNKILIAHKEWIDDYASRGFDDEIGKLLASHYKKFNRIRDLELGEAMEDPRRANLCGADLQGFDLAGADLRGANLIGVDLREVDLSKSNLSQAYLVRANFSGLTTFKIAGINLSNAYMIEVDLRKSRFFSANFRNTELGKADLSEAKFSDLGRLGILSKGTPSQVEHNLSFNFANFTGANLSRTELIAVDLSYSDLTGTNLNGTIMTWSNLYRANYEPKPGSLPAILIYFL